MRLSLNQKYLVFKYHRKHWYRMITMLIKSEYNLVMNHKKVYRLMNKYDLFSIIRNKNQYKQIWKANQEHRTFNNILNRRFRWLEPFKKLWTDITYIKLNWKWCYLSIIKDIISWEIISHKISSNLGLWFVILSIKELKNKYQNNLKWALIHSDQWFHYTSSGLF